MTKHVGAALVLYLFQLNSPNTSLPIFQRLVRACILMAKRCNANSGTARNSPLMPSWSVISEVKVLCAFILWAQLICVISQKETSKNKHRRSSL